ncbi:GNAT family N-acetyltransferase [Halovenus halobia]|uniref:GNAT family N-acetyltransferase n=1 Tax=Halovenus halobia TaxID=3396622 RepID=UPI003F54AD6E
MELVEATEADLGAITDRWYRLAKSMENYSELNELVYDDASEVSEEGFRNLLADDETMLYLITTEGETIGYLMVREGEHPSRQYSQYLRLVDIAIDEQYRNQGHGTAAVERLKELAQQRDCDHLKLSCEWQNDRARRFYRKLDFQPKQVEYVQPLE